MILTELNMEVEYYLSLIVQQLWSLYLNQNVIISSLAHGLI